MRNSQPSEVRISEIPEDPQIPATPGVPKTTTLSPHSSISDLAQGVKNTIWRWGKRISGEWSLHPNATDTQLSEKYLQLKQEYPIDSVVRIVKNHGQKIHQAVVLEYFDDKETVLLLVIDDNLRDPHQRMYLMRTHEFEHYVPDRRLSVLQPIEAEPIYKIDDIIYHKNSKRMVEEGQIITMDPSQNYVKAFFPNCKKFRWLRLKDINQTLQTVMFSGQNSTFTQTTTFERTINGKPMQVEISASLDIDGVYRIRLTPRLLSENHTGNEASGFITMISEDKCEAKTAYDYALARAQDDRYDLQHIARKLNKKHYLPRPPQTTLDEYDDEWPGEPDSDIIASVPNTQVAIEPPPLEHAPAFAEPPTAIQNHALAEQPTVVHNKIAWTPEQQASTKVAKPKQS